MREREEREATTPLSSSNLLLPSRCRWAHFTRLRWSCTASSRSPSTSGTRSPSSVLVRKRCMKGGAHTDPYPFTHSLFFSLPLSHLSHASHRECLRSQPACRCGGCGDAGRQGVIPCLLILDVSLRSHRLSLTPLLLIRTGAHLPCHSIHDHPALQSGDLGTTQAQGQRRPAREGVCVGVGGREIE